MTEVLLGYKEMNTCLEKLSCINFQKNDNDLLLLDLLKDKSFKINQTALEICELIDGKRTLIDICQVLSEKYLISIEEIQEDVYGFYKFLVSNKLAIKKGTIGYYLIATYQKIIRI